MKFTNIEWDTDGISIDDLPEECEVDDDQTFEDAVDSLTDKYGWCIKNLCVEMESAKRTPMIVLEMDGNTVCYDPDTEMDKVYYAIQQALTAATIAGEEVLHIAIGEDE